DRPDLGAYEVHHPLSPVGVPADFSTLYGPHPSDTTLIAFIKGLYQGTLLRAPADDEVDFYVRQFQGHLITREQMAANFVNSPENRGNQVRYFYRYFLGREPAQAEVDYYVQRLQAGEDEGLIMQNFI